MAESYPTILAGQRITASLLSSMQPQALRKTSDTAISASTTQVADPHITLSVAANSVWLLWGWLKYDAATAGDLAIGWSYPSGTLGEWVGHGGGTTVTSATGGGGTQQDIVSTWGYNVRLETTDITATRTYGGLGLGNQLTVGLYATFRVSTTGGTLAMTWAQGASSASATTVYTDSWVIAQRVS